MIVFPNTKINIGLNIVSDRSDGYHNLETLFYPIGISDALEVIPGEEGDPEYTFTSYGLPVAGDVEKNLVVKALHLVKMTHEVPPVHIWLDKRSPMGAGLGGGSADGAFMLVLLNQLFKLDISENELIGMAAKLGADCPFFVVDKPVYATGIGEQMTPVSLSLDGFWIVVVKPDVFVSTKDAFAGIHSTPTQIPVCDLITRPMEDWKNCISNDFEGSIFPKFPVIAEVKRLLYRAGAVYASMSGSGASVFGLFRSEPDEKLKNKLPAGCFYYQNLL